ncbi:phosphoglycolate phosphatase [Sulfolobaceae archaeon RB850M]|jgi:phosphoglycolate phosphatase (TIGR01487 family)
MYIFVSDFDRTLSCEKDGFKIREDVAKAINEFSRSYPFFVVTGRERRFLNILASGLKPTGWVIENGAIVIYEGKEYITVNKEWFKEREKIINFLSSKGINYSVGEVIIYVNNAESKLFDGLPDYVSVEWNRSDAMILPRGVNKGHGVLFIKNSLGFKGKIVAIGDSQNDIPMFQVADIKVTVKNALDMIKNMADIILPKEDGEGVKEFLLKILKGEITL